MMRILLNDEGIDKAYNEHPEYTHNSIRRKAIARAQLKQVAHAIEAMTADGYWLEDIVKAILKEAE